MATSDSHIRSVVDDETSRDDATELYVLQYRPPGEDAWESVAVFPDADGALTTVAEAAAGKFDGYLPAGPHYRVVDQRTGRVVVAENG